jgi:predicted  nucleic acid-binding Zn-ribbon protein
MWDTGTSSATSNMNDPIFDTDVAPTGYNREISSVRIRKETEKQNKAIKEAVKNWMADDVQIAVAKEAEQLFTKTGQLFTEVQKLKKENEQLLNSIFIFKKEMKEMKEGVQAEMKSMEEMLEKYANQILRYQNMDL